VSNLINPGAHIGASTQAQGWTNTYEEAKRKVREWHDRMTEEGIRDVELILPGIPVNGEGRWTFLFRHTVTGVDVELETHGINDLDAYQRQHLFLPRVYWNGSSTSDPKPEDWAAPGFEIVKTLRPINR